MQKTAIAASIATDHLMTFRGRFADSLIAEQLDRISVSFLAEELHIRRGGVGGNIAFGMGSLGQHPILVAAAGQDFADYRSWLERHGVDCESVRISDSLHTARFVCTTDDDLAQMATFYAGAMAEAREIELQPVAERVGGLDLVLIGADAPEAMRRHAAECRERGFRFIADPSQQLAYGDGELIRSLVEGAEYLLTNEYESHLTEQKTGWSAADIAALVPVRVITRGKDGATIHVRGEEPVQVSAALVENPADPTGVGDAFRAGFITGLSTGLGHERSAQIGSVLAAFCLESVGTQEYRLDRGAFLQRIAVTYGDEAAAEIDPHLVIHRSHDGSTALPVGP